MTSLLYPSEPEVWKSHLGPKGAARSWITAGTKAPLPEWLTSEEVATHNGIFDQGGYTAPLNWLVTNTQIPTPPNPIHLSRQTNPAPLPPKKTGTNPPSAASTPPPTPKSPKPANTSTSPLCWWCRSATTPRAWRCKNREWRRGSRICASSA